MSFVIAGGNDNHCASTPGDSSDFNSAVEVMGLYGVILLMQETSEHELTDLDSELPSDTHCVKYLTPQGDVRIDAVRSYSMSDIFDAYHDAGNSVVGIISGFGRIKPKLFVDKRKDS